MARAGYIYFDAFGRQHALAFWHQVPEQLKHDAWDPVLAAHFVRQAYEGHKLDHRLVSEFAAAHFGPMGSTRLGNFDGAIDCIIEGIRNCRILVLRSQLLPGTERTGTTDELSLAARRFWGAFGSPFLFSGRTYRLVFSETYADAIRAGDYEAVRPQQAQEILAALAKLRNCSRGVLPRRT